MRKLAILAVVGLVVAHVSVTAQMRPSFAGVWTLVAERTTPADAMPLGPQVRIEQTPAALTITSQVTRLNLRQGGSSSVTPGGFTSTVYELDGIHHARPVTDAVRVTSPQTESVSYRATWTDDQLVIMTRDALRIRVDAQPPVLMERVIRQVLSLDADRNLVMDTLVVSDPVPGGARQDPPIPVRAVYRRLP
jgi:hypothetical protein